MSNTKMKHTHQDSASQQQHSESETRAAESVEIAEPPLDPDSPAAQRLLTLIGRMIAMRHSQAANDGLKDRRS